MFNQCLYSLIQNGPDIHNSCEALVSVYTDTERPLSLQTVLIISLTEQKIFENV